MMKKGKDKLHYFYFYNNKYIMLSIGIFWLREFGILFKKNGTTLDININIGLCYIHLTFWDRGMKKIKEKLYKTLNFNNIKLYLQNGTKI